MEKQDGRYFILGVFLLLIFVASIAQFVAAPLAPFLIGELGLNKTQLGFLASAVFWGIVSFGMVAGIAIDKIGEKKMILFGSIMISFALLFFSYSHTFTLLLVASILIGVGYSGLNILTTSGLTKWFPFNERAFAIGLKQSGMPLGTAVGAAVLPVLALNYSWSFSVKVLFVVMLLLGVICFLLYREKNEGPTGNPSRKQSPARYKQKEKQVSIFSLLKNKRMLIVNLMGVGLVINQIAIMTFTIPYLQETLSLSAVKAAQYLAFFQLSGVLSRPFFGLVGDRAFKGERHYTLFLLSILNSVSILVLSLISPVFPAWLVFSVVIFSGFTALGWYGPLFALITEVVGEESAGKALGIGVTFNCLGISIGTPLFGFIVDMTGNFPLAYRLFALFLTLDAIVFMCFYLRTRSGRSVRIS